MSDQKNNFKKYGSRYKARKRAISLLFEAEIRDIPIQELVQERKKLKLLDSDLPGVPEYTEILLQGYAIQQSVVDQRIKAALQEWELFRLPTVDREILRVATWELLFNPEVPSSVAIDEAIELAKELSTDKSANFINGVLATINS